MSYSIRKSTKQSPTFDGAQIPNVKQVKSATTEAMALIGDSANDRLHIVLHLLRLQIENLFHLFRPLALGLYLRTI